MLRTAAEVAIGIWAISGLGVAVWAAYEMRRLGLGTAGHTPAPSRAPAPATEGSEIGAAPEDAGTRGAERTREARPRP